MKISLFLEHPVPKPWSEDKERQVFQDALELVELADKVGVHCVWITEHHFLEEYSPLVGAGDLPGRRQPAHQEHPPRPRHHAHAAEHQPPRPCGRAHRYPRPRLQRPGRVRHRRGVDGGRAGRLRRRPGREAGAVGRGLARRPALHDRDALHRVQGHVLDMPARNVIPKPVQKPHPPLWLACTRPNTTYLAAERGLGGLGFSFVSPEDMTDRVEQYYKIFEEKCVPMGYAPNPNMLAIGGEMPLMCCTTEEEAVQNLGHRRRVLRLRDHVLLQLRYARPGQHGPVGHVLRGRRRRSHGGLRARPRPGRHSRHAAGLVQALRSVRGRRVHVPHQPGLPRGDHGVPRVFGQHRAARDPRARRARRPRRRRSAWRRSSRRPWLAAPTTTPRRSTPSTASVVFPPAPRPGHRRRGAHRHPGDGRRPGAGRQASRRLPREPRPSRRVRARRPSTAGGRGDHRGAA